MTYADILRQVAVYLDEKPSGRDLECIDHLHDLADLIDERHQPIISGEGLKLRHLRASTNSEVHVGEWIERLFSPLPIADT